MGKVLKTWSDEEINFIKANASSLSDIEIAKKLNRTHISVSAKRKRLGLLKFNFWTKTEEEFLKNNYCKDEIDLTKISKTLHRSKASVIWKASELGLTNISRPKSEKTKAKLKQYTGEKASGWKNGKPHCKYCGKEINYKSTTCQKCKTIDWTDEHRRKIREGTSETMKGKMPANINRPGKFMNIKRGFFNINGKDMFFRSKWEANYAIYLNWLIKNKIILNWEYEADIFMFEKIKSGTRSYRPDFKITNNDQSIEYHEIKGWMTPRSKTQISRMKKYYPNIKLIVIDTPLYHEIERKVGGLLKFY